MYPHEERYAFRYLSKDGREKVCYPRSKEKRDENYAYCKAHGVTVVSCQKLYPFSTEKNQHNFGLIHDICFNTMYDMESGEVPMDKAEYERLSDLKDRAERFFCLPLPIAWLPWEEYRDAKEIAQMAILHRQNACIENGRPDLVAYC